MDDKVCIQNNNDLEEILSNESYSLDRQRKVARGQKFIH